MTRPWKPSVTVAAIIERGGRFLLVEEETSDGIRINQPAGHLDPGETLIDAAARETLEETAHRFRPSALLGVYLWSANTGRQSDATFVRFAFIGDVDSVDTGRKLDKGILRTLWLTPDELRARQSEHRSPLVAQCVEDYLAGQRYPLTLLHTHPSVIRP